MSGDPDVVEAAAAVLSGSSAFADVAAGVGSAAVVALAGWEGEAGMAARAAFARFGPALTAGDEACRALAPALRAYAAEQRAAQEEDVSPMVDGAEERVRLADERAARAVDAAREQLAAMAVAGPAVAATPAPAPRSDATVEPGLLNTLGHTALDVVGLVPIVGEAADVANAAWYGVEGDYLAAGLSLAAAIPIAGWAFTGGKLGVKGVDTIKAVTNAGGAAAWVKGRPSMVPWNAERLTYKGGVGEKYRWTDPFTGKVVNYHAHPASSTAPAGSNSAAGPTYRIQIGNHHIDADGTRYTRNQLDARSPAYSPRGANDTHIPYPTDQPVGWDAGRRVFVPNPTSVADGTDGTEGDSR